MITNTSEKVSQQGDPVGYELESDGRYRIDNYDNVPAFSSFLPGIAGPDGVPLWCMYVNRCQGVVSFGVANKDNAIAEFLPSTWAYQLVGVQGFRTFCKIDNEYYEPFQKNVISASHDYKRTMWISPDRVKYAEQNQTLGVNFNVEYFSPVNKPIGSLVRTVEITNTTNSPKKISGLDGLSLLLPASFSDFIIKSMRHISEAYVSVQKAYKHVPFYSTKVMAHDEAEVVKITQGNFYFSRMCKDGNYTSLDVLVDPEVIFGAESDLITPRRFIAESAIDVDSQVWENRLPCAMAMFDSTLNPGETIKIVSMTGQSPNKKMLGTFLQEFDALETIDAASIESKKLITSITNPAFMLSNLPVLNEYTRQNYLDNILRGGIPRLMPSVNGSAPIYLYSRRHGDLERDYNFFELPQHPLSSGVGNYRDICQNARNNVHFYPQVLDHEIRMFVGLLQADGYNPLAVHGYRWKLADGVDIDDICPIAEKEALEKLEKILNRQFHPGELIDWLDRNDVHVTARNEWLDKILRKSDCQLVADGHEGGYWIDHWTYITDMLESFASVYPEQVRNIMTLNADIGWFDEGAFVQPAKDKYVLRASAPLQLNAVVDGKPAEALAETTVFGKLCALLAVKAVSLDYDGRGIEMEAGRPGWNDSLNGLPALFGSSTCETAEAARMAQWLCDNLDRMPDTILPELVADFIESVIDIIEPDKYDWNAASMARYEYRENIKNNSSDKTKTLSGDKLHQLLNSVVKLMESGVKRSVDTETGLIDTYYLGEPVNETIQKNGDGSDRNDPKGSPLLDVNKLQYKPMPLFLEGQVHLLRLIDDVKTARQIYNSTRSSTLFDVELEMYKLNECLKDCPAEIGRARTFSRGWFENESIWLHMSHKYLLELLRCGLIDEFFNDARTMFVPFMDPVVYGRSVVENSSFISSSACPDPKARGRGFIARLSGTTAEFIHIWLILTAGEKPFYLKDGRLNFKLTPTLPAEWFTTEKTAIEWNGNTAEIDENCFACALLGNILLVYHNTQRKNTFGDSSVGTVGYSIDGGDIIDAEHLGPEYAIRIRNRQFKRIDVHLR